MCCCNYCGEGLVGLSALRDGEVIFYIFLLAKMKQHLAFLDNLNLLSLKFKAIVWKLVNIDRNEQILANFG